MKVNWDDEIPNISGKIKLVFQTTNQPTLFDLLGATTVSNVQLRGAAQDEDSDHHILIRPFDKSPGDKSATG